MATKADLERKIKELELQIKLTEKIYEKIITEVQGQLDIYIGATLDKNLHALGD